jgi:hypothetical protein
MNNLTIVVAILAIIGFSYIEIPKPALAESKAPSTNTPTPSKPRESKLLAGEKSL